MSVYRFSSCLAVQMDRFVNLRRLSGTDYHSQTRLLGYFDRFLAQQGLTTLAPRTQGNRMSVLRQFCEFLAVSNPESYVPRTLKIIRSHSVHRPYIYHLQQLRALLAAALTTHIYVEIDMEMKRKMIAKAGAPQIGSQAPWQKPNVLQWLDRLAKEPQLCGANY